MLKHLSLIVNTSTVISVQDEQNERQNTPLCRISRGTQCAGHYTIDSDTL